MCGIAGIFHLDGAAVAPESLRGMIRMLAHRGPDDTGFYAENGVGLAHARLSIIDPAGGKQPMCNEDRSLWITFNGEIFNYLELRQQLPLRDIDSLLTRTRRSSSTFTKKKERTASDT